MNPPRADLDTDLGGVITPYSASRMRLASWMRRGDAYASSGADDEGYRRSGEGEGDSYRCLPVRLRLCAELRSEYLSLSLSLLVLSSCVVV